MSFTKLREMMVYYQIEGRGIADKKVLDAMRKVPREIFVPEDLINLSYADSALPLDLDQSISQPFIVAYMIEALKVKPEHKVLEVGTGSGYSAAILSLLAKSVYSIEIIKTLAEEAEERLWSHGYENVFVKHGDGHEGLLSQAPFDRIILTAASEKILYPLMEQLVPGGIMVAPIGDSTQFLYHLTKKADGSIEKELLRPVSFVPMVASPLNQKVA